MLPHETGPCYRSHRGRSDLGRNATNSPLFLPYAVFSKDDRPNEIGKRCRDRYPYTGSSNREDDVMVVAVADVEVAE